MTDLQLEKQVKRLEIKLENLVEYLNLSHKGPHFGPPDGRKEYDAMVQSALEKAGL